MKKEKKTKTKKTKKYKIWFVIMVVPILLSILPITSFALFNVNINNNYLSSISYTSNGLSYSQQTYTNDDTSIQFTLSRNADKVAVTYNYGSITTEPITHINASFEVKNTENGTPVKRLSNETPVCAGYQLSGDIAEIVRYNLNITEYVNRYKYSIDSDVDIGIEQLTTVQFQFNIDSQSGTIDINYISITLTFGQSQEQVTVDLSGIESQLDNLNEQISGLTNDDDYIGLNNISMVRVYGVRNDPNNNPTLYTIDDYTVDNNVLKFDTLYTTYQEILRFTFDTVDIKTIQIQLRSNMLLSDGTILRHISDYQPIISYGIQPPTPNGSYNDIMNRMPINNPPVHYLYTYENDNVNKNGVTTLWIRLNMRGVSVTNQIWDIKIKINDIEYQIKMSAKEAENAVSEYESYINSLYPDESALQSIADIPQDIIENIDQYSPGIYDQQYSWFTINVFNTTHFLIMMLLISTSFMLIGFIFFGKAR